MTDDMLLASLDDIPVVLLAYLHARDIHTVGELLGATQGLLVYPKCPLPWESLYQQLQDTLPPVLLQEYRHPVLFPATGMKEEP